MLMLMRYPLNDFVQALNINIYKEPYVLHVRNELVNAYRMSQKKSIKLLIGSLAVNRQL